MFSNVHHRTTTNLTPRTVTVHAIVRSNEKATEEREVLVEALARERG